MNGIRPSLPALAPDELEHSERLIGRIRDAIEAAGGWISFERYMELALYEPGLGYYSAGARKLGAAGDFVTAPEISPLFGRTLAAQCEEALVALGGGSILEFGAGSGVMAADVLTELAARGRLPERYLIVEVSADLKARQRETLHERLGTLAGERVLWLDAPPSGFTGVVLGNELLDAFPVERFRIRGNDVNALGVSWQLGRLEWSEVRAGPALLEAVRSIEASLERPLPEGYTSEWSPRLGPWMAALADCMHRGVVILIDYGLPRAQYYRDERREGTLLCHFRHRFHDDPFTHVGLQDIGAWVDFTAVAEAAVAAGLAVAGFATQAHFLIGNGIDRLLAIDQQGEDLPGRLQIARQAMVLTLPGEMGERFKVIALTKGYDAPLSGFSVRDLTATL
ncbi:MAG TPA: SAM-dependent methyltransferase [Steroidobacteraceae bacterium]|nr:SAM-dependent methyltransferase [Steroidobacteraceae bacterium]